MSFNFEAKAKQGRSRSAKARKDGGSAVLHPGATLKLPPRCMAEKETAKISHVFPGYGTPSQIDFQNDSYVNDFGLSTVTICKAG